MGTGKLPLAVVKEMRWKEVIARECWDSSAGQSGRL